MPCHASYLDAHGTTEDVMLDARYDERTRMTRWRFGKDRVMVATYEGARLVRWEQTGAEPHTFDYDDRGHLVRSRGEQDGRVESTYTYDEHDNLIRIEDLASGTSELSYDAKGRLSSVVIDGLALEYAYDARGRLATMRRNHLAELDLAYGYDPATDLLVSITSAVTNETLVYDERRRPVSVTKRQINSVTKTPITERWTYQYDCR